MISVIVPVYNVELYISNCIESILKQQYENFELLLIDDGSSDNSGTICDKYISNKHVKVFHKENGGVSSARNFGIDRCQGDWICFFDADDTISPYTLYKLGSVINEFPCIESILYNYQEISLNEGRKIINHQLPLNVIMDKSQIINRVLYSCFDLSPYIASLWTKVYKKEVIDKNRLKFKDRIRGEDWEFNVRYFQHIDKAVAINDVFYNYIRRHNSAMGLYNPEQFELWLENRSIHLDLINKFKFEVNRSKYSNRFLRKVFFYLKDIVMNENPKDAKIKISMIISSKEIIEMMQSVKLFDSCISDVFIYFTIRYSNVFFLYYFLILWNRMKN